MHQHQYKNMTIQIAEDPGYEYGTDNNHFEYSRQHYAGMAYDYPSSKHGVKIFENENLVADCVVIGYGGRTAVSQTSSLIEDDQLLLCCGNSVFCMSLPNLELKWKMEADPSSCCEIFSHEDYYLVHGDLQAAKLNKDGDVEWEFNDVGILMSTDGHEVFKIENDGILLTNLEGVKYKIDFNGKQISESQ